jgi:hypothetical protein
LLFTDPKDYKLIEIIEVKNAQQKLLSDPACLESLILLSTFAIQVHRYNDALELLAGALSHHPHSPEAHKLMAILYNKTGRPEEAHQHEQYCSDYLFNRNFIDCNLLVMSFPKSGRTWIRTLMARVIQQTYNLSSLPILSADEWNSQLWPKILFSHGNSPGDDGISVNLPDEFFKTNKPFILLIRDPRDVLVSNYFHLTRRTRIFQPSLSLDEFAKDKIHGLKAILSFMSFWKKNISYMSNAVICDYQDIHRDPREILRQLFSKVQIEVQDSTLTDAIDFASFKNMQIREASGENNHVATSTKTPTDPESFKTRKGKMGGYRDYMSVELIDQISGVIEHWPDPLFNHFSDLN